MNDAADTPPREGELLDLEIDLFLEALFRRYQHDFRGYARPTLRRRLAQALSGLPAAAAAALTAPGRLR